ncbi:FKBP-type peptidyl-prolyl cis-trans isomerase [Pseudomonas sp. MT3]|uniref:FKBP-type peptidyl-prolyl cis-trans isomerase n=1 Tax=Pseudomonas sp. ATCC 13867 TaxID=1294143 RepID=UPI0002C4F74C|nr:FKBP-type peptidyl-prolyl cis-trans isomerase [Pseudomonas sp. ATCC 13867]AGI22141.1 putative isomerase [Pseudomonas sp. ATCC 13867]RFQ34036.1 FKBP-type peptidyl-prolyl cis-trans isomerase [Pseudomonas sp. ATCC 13867]
MLRLAPLCVLITPLLASAAPPRDELAYALGVQLGERLHQEAPGIAIDDLLEGLRQSYRGEPLALPEARMKQVLGVHDQQQEGTSAQAQSADAARAAERRFLVNEKARYGVRELPGGVLISELKGGRGNGNPQLREVRVNYIGNLADGSPFDASASPQWFRLDTVIPGWRIALQAMPMGARWRVVVPSAQAYGAEGAGDLIPAYAPLVFEIELLESR